MNKLIIQKAIDKKGALFAIKNPDSEIEVVEDEEETGSKYDLITIKEIDYIKLDKKIYTIDEEGEPYKIYGTLQMIKI